jgi:transposase
VEPIPSTPEQRHEPASEQMVVALAAQPKTNPKTKKVKTSMAKKTAPKKSAAKAEVNKSEEIRKLAKELQAKGEPVRPKTIVEILKKRGIKIAPPQASMVLKKAGFRPRKRRKSGAAAVAAVPVVKKTSKSTLSIEDLLRAKKMAEEFGGAEKLVNAISALVELQ